MEMLPLDPMYQLAVTFFPPVGCTDSVLAGLIIISYAGPYTRLISVYFHR